VSFDILTGDRQRDERNVRILLESVQELYGTLDHEETLVRAVDRAVLVTGAERALLLIGGTGGGLEVRVARGRGGKALGTDARFSQSVATRVWSTGVPSVTIDTADQRGTSLSESLLALRLVSVMAVPLPVRGENLGVLYVDSTARVREFTPGDLVTFQALAGFVALAVERARLREEQAEKERLQREREVARQVQQGLLPRELPQPPGFELAALGRPCDETSGDYYDAIPFAEGSLALVVGDVSGHGLGAALLMASTRALVHSFLQQQRDLVVVMSAVNAFLERDLPDNAFMSLFLGALDPERRELLYVSAGHNPPLLHRTSGSVQELVRTGPVLGVTRRARFLRSDIVDLQPGDVLLLYTDGIFEARNGDGEMYGEARLRAAFAQRALAGARAREIVDGLLGDLLAFVGDQALEDDVSCLVLRVLQPPPGPGPRR
jgi:serine phosphatase RsbU (regulator of sigma subunit)